jgi:hypothetical protein
MLAPDDVRLEPPDPASALALPPPDRAARARRWREEAAFFDARAPSSENWLRPGSTAGDRAVGPTCEAGGYSKDFRFRGARSTQRA